jgi:hypothetical protein
VIDLEKAQACFDVVLFKRGEWLEDAAHLSNKPAYLNATKRYNYRCCGIVWTAVRKGGGLLRPPLYSPQTLADFRGELWFRYQRGAGSIPHMLPGVEPGPDPAVFHRVDHRIERAAASALLAFVWTCECTIFFAKQYLLALMAALDRSDDGCTFHLNAPS